MVGWWDELRGLFALSRPGVRRIARARQDLLVSLSVLLARYQTETGTVLLPGTRRSFRQRVPWRLLAITVVLGLAAFLMWQIGTD